MNTAVIQVLKDWGCDTDGALRRMCGDAELYVELLNNYIVGFDLDKLKSAVAQGNSAAAFEFAHSMKGVFGNLGITPIYELTCGVTELFRAGSCDNYSEPLEKIETLLAELKGILTANG